MGPSCVVRRCSLPRVAARRASTTEPGRPTLLNVIWPPISHSQWARMTLRSYSRGRGGMVTGPRRSFGTRITRNGRQTSASGTTAAGSSWTGFESRPEHKTASDLHTRLDGRRSGTWHGATATRAPSTPPGCHRGDPRGHTFATDGHRSRDDDHVLDIDRVHGRDHGKRAEHDRVSAVDLDSLPGGHCANAPPPLATPRARWVRGGRRGGSGRAGRRRWLARPPLHDSTAGHCSCQLGPDCRQPGKRRTPVTASTTPPGTRRPSPAGGTAGPTPTSASPPPQRHAWSSSTSTAPQGATTWHTAVQASRWQESTPPAAT